VSQEVGAKTLNINKGDEMSETIEAEIVEDEFLAPAQVTAKKLTTLVNVDNLIKKYKTIADTPLKTDVEELGALFLELQTARKEFTNGRIKLEKEAKALRDPYNAFAKLVIKIEKEVQAKINPYENKLRALTDKVENEEKRKQIEAEEAEEARINAIRIKIKAFEMLPLQYINNTSDEILAMLNDSVNPTEETFNEFFNEAVTVFTNSHSQLRKIHDDKILVENAQKMQDEKDVKAREAKEIEDKKLQDEKDALAKQQSDFQKQKDDFEAQQKAIQEEADRKEAERVADELQAKQESEKKITQEKIKNLEFPKEIYIVVGYEMMNDEPSPIAYESTNFTLNDAKQFQDRVNRNTKIYKAVEVI